VRTQVDPPEDIEVPASLLPEDELQRLVAERQPRFVPLARYGPDSDPLPPPDAATGAALSVQAVGHVCSWRYLRCVGLTPPNGHHVGSPTLPQVELNSQGCGACELSHTYMCCAWLHFPGATVGQQTQHADLSFPSCAQH
jgi:hypothetical protein